MRIGEVVCFKLAKLFRKWGVYGPFSGGEEVTEDVHFDFQFNDTEKNYKTLRQFMSIEDKKVLDLGCGLGAKTLYYALKGARRVVGVDTDEEIIERARRRLKRSHADLSEKVKFEVCGDRAIPFDSETFDVVITTATFEHIRFPETVLDECWRVVRTNGYIYIDFQPWLGCHGAHLYHLSPIPWCHILFSERTLINAAARIYESGNYQKTFWEFDIETGQRKPNTWKQMDRLEGLNKMTLRRFKAIIRNSGYPVRHFGLYGYEDSEKKWVRNLARILKIALSLYPLSEFTTSRIVCILQKK